ncbi:MAG: SDR family oxidoreductase, partial [Alphaproteobacteria bacterium]|nr:SDR family oxidoreductase [Alphaproteobacteria bacterium]
MSDTPIAGKARGRKSIFITGAASGMGRQTARLFRQQDWFVGITDVNREGLRLLEEEIGSENCYAACVDVSDKQALDASLSAFAQETGGKLDLLFANAGIGESGWFEDVPFDATVRLVQVNLIGVIASIYAALPLLKATPGALVFITSSSSATHGMPRIAVYSATKFAVKGLAEALSIEFSRFGVRVADVLPGLIDTAILRNTPNRSGDRSKPSEDVFYATAPKRGMFRLLPPESVAQTVWAAYHKPRRLHWYVPAELVWIDRLKAIFPAFVRGR